MQDCMRIASSKRLLKTYYMKIKGSVWQVPRLFLKYLGLWGITAAVAWIGLYIKKLIRR